MLNCINRNCKNFSKSFSYSSVRLIFDYKSVVQSLFTVGITQAIEALQNRFFFLRLIVFKCGIYHEKHASYDSLFSFLKLKSINRRKITLDLYLIYELLNSYSELLHKLNFFVHKFLLISYFS